eukprot:scaffold21581_cov101-Isochrysis_galbana.AAC.2
MEAARSASGSFLIWSHVFTRPPVGGAEEDAELDMPSDAWASEDVVQWRQSAGRDGGGMPDQSVNHL